MCGHLCTLEDVHIFVWHGLILAWIHHSHRCSVKSVILNKAWLYVPVPGPSDTKAWLIEPGQLPDVTGCFSGFQSGMLLIIRELK